jgi:hypothetical protein
MQMTLGTSLAVLGAVVVVLIAVHGWWTARRAAPRRPAQPAPASEQRVEPGFDAEDTQPATPPPELRAPLLRRPARLDALIDALVPLTLESPVSGESVPTRRYQGLPDRRAGQRDGAVGATHRRPPLRGAAGRRATGQPQRSAQ